MPKVIYSVGRAPEWLDAAERLRDEHGWQPVFWMTNPMNAEDVETRFPDVPCHLVTDVNRCIAEGLDAATVIGRVDAPTAQAFAGIEATVMELLDRFEMGSSYSYQERYLHYLWFLGFCLYTVDRLKPDVLVLNVAPH
jgi:hypothetical protein